VIVTSFLSLYRSLSEYSHSSMILDLFRFTNSTIRDLHWHCIHFKLGIWISRLPITLTFTRTRTSCLLLTMLLFMYLSQCLSILLLAHLLRVIAFLVLKRFSFHIHMVCWRVRIISRRTLQLRRCIWIISRRCVVLILAPVLLRFFRNHKRHTRMV
jgi:hypothetical protein